MYLNENAASPLAVHLFQWRTNSFILLLEKVLYYRLNFEPISIADTMIYRVFQQMKNKAGQAGI